MFELGALAARSESFDVSVDGHVALRDRSGCGGRAPGATVEVLLWLVPSRTGSFSFPLVLVGADGANLSCTLPCVSSGMETVGDEDSMRCSLEPGRYRVRGTVRRARRARAEMQVAEVCIRPREPPPQDLLQCVTTGRPVSECP